MDEAQILKHIIESRKSSFPRDYTDQEIPHEILEEILNSARFAPNHKKTKPWRFQLFRKNEKAGLGQKLAEIYKETTPSQIFLEKKYIDISSKISRADAVITVSVNFSGLVPEWEEIAAVAMAVQNMYLTCTAHKVGCYWSTPGMIKHIDEYLQLEPNQKCYGLFYLGKI
ncbi:MAG: nitroreductase [Weeksellaceae bacterium]|nr:nitroreductase [Weeksellaceae bacterium]